MQNPLVSIIVPIYKVEPYLRRCLDSIVNQTYTNLEIILVDDGSPDACPQICDEYAARDKRIVVIHKENGGLSDARNAGLDICKGEYISFVDSDDWIDKHFVELLVGCIQNKNADIAIGKYKKVYNYYENNKFENKYTPQIEILSNIASVEKLFGKDEVTFVIAWGKIYRKTLFNGIRFPVGKLYEDEYITYQLLYKSSRTVYLKKILYFYFQRAQSIMSLAEKNSLRLLNVRMERFLFFKKHAEKLIVEKCLRNLCWDILFAWWTFEKKGNVPLFSSSEEILHKYRELTEVYFSTGRLTCGKIIHKFFSKYPQAYSFYRNISPFTIRKV